jgi:hypothetical protein
MQFIETPSRVLGEEHVPTFVSTLMTRHILKTRHCTRLAVGVCDEVNVVLAGVHGSV